MKKLSLLITCSRIIVFLLFVLFVYSIENTSSLLVLIPIVLDICLVYFHYQIIKTKEEENQLVFVAHRRPWNSNFIKTITVFNFFGFLIFYFLILKADIFQSIGIIIPFYTIVVSLLFYNGFDGYIIDNTGIIQQGFLESNYKWSEIDRISINDKSLEYVINTKEYKTNINKKNSLKIIEFLNFIGKHYSA